MEFNFPIGFCRSIAVNAPMWSKTKLVGREDDNVESISQQKMDGHRQQHKRLTAVTQTQKEFDECEIIQCVCVRSVGGWREWMSSWIRIVRFSNCQRWRMSIVAISIWLASIVSRLCQLDRATISRFYLYSTDNRPFEMPRSTAAMHAAHTSQNGKIFSRGIFAWKCVPLTCASDVLHNFNANQLTQKAFTSLATHTSGALGFARDTTTTATTTYVHLMHVFGFTVNVVGPSVDSIEFMDQKADV